MLKEDVEKIVKGMGFEINNSFTLDGYSYGYESKEGEMILYKIGSREAFYYPDGGAPKSYAIGSLKKDRPNRESKRTLETLRKVLIK